MTAVGPYGWLALAHVALASALTADLLLRRREPVSTMAWLQAVAFLPFLGAALYLLLGSGSIQRKRYRRRRRRLGAFDPRSERAAPRRGRAGSAALPQGCPAEAVALAAASSRRPPSLGNAVKVFDNVSLLYEELERAVAAARRHVHFEYYLVQPDATGRRFLDLLTERARRGVEVRLLLDAVGSRGLTDAHLRPLSRAGGQVAWFLPFRGFSRLNALHMRNHRKIAVVDGAVAFSGGANLGDEYRGRRARRPHWRDLHMKIEGPAACDLQEVFAEDWWFAAEEKLARDDYFPPVPPAGDAVVHVVESGPDDPARAIHATLFHAIATARERVWIATPYFIPDEPMALALETAARRGVDVRLMVPRVSDHPLVDRAGESFLPVLLEAGGKVYRYEAGMLHSKLVTVDGRWGTAGSANMDIRSFRWNFEVNLVLLSASSTRDLEAVFRRDLAQSRPVRRSELGAASWPHRLSVATCRLLAPLL